MARLSRNLVPGLVQHVIQRDNNRQAIFFADGDYRLYFDSLQLAAERYACAIHAYVLITNHVRLLVTPATEDGLSFAADAKCRAAVMCAISIQYTSAREPFGRGGSSPLWSIRSATC
jgi:REP element-mobilizing transposase RayT